MLGTSRRGCAAALLALAFVIASAIAPPGRAQAPDPAGTTADVVVFEPVDGQGLIGVADRGLFRGRVAVRGSSSGLIVVNELAP